MFKLIRMLLLLALLAHFTAAVPFVRDAMAWPEAWRHAHVTEPSMAFSVESDVPPTSQASIVVPRASVGEPPATWSHGTIDATHIPDQE